MSARRARPTFAEAYDEHIWHVYGFFAYRLASRQDAEDLTQATFERALRAWPRYAPRKAAPGTWLIAIARNLLIDHHRADRSGGHVELTEAHEPGGLDAGHDLGLAPEMEAALRSLSPREREVVALRFGADLTGPQIADLTGTKVD